VTIKKIADNKYDESQARVAAAGAAIQAAGLKGAWSISHAIDSTEVEYTSTDGKKIKGVYIDATQFKSFIDLCLLLDMTVTKE
jgi:hypothetical protein